MEALSCSVRTAEDNQPKVELATIFQSLGIDFPEKAHLSFDQERAFYDITTCRTAAKGGHLWRCETCSHCVNQYNSCLNRHCPKCQGKARYQWVSARMAEVINCRYFHVVFTLPHELNSLIVFNPKPMLKLLFQSVSQTLLAFGRDPKYLGGELGFITVLHTWTQKLERHYHLHCIIPGGVLSSDGTEWISCTNPKYLFPEAALADTFRRLYWHGSGSNKNAEFKNPIPVKFTGLRDFLLQKALILPPENKDYFLADKVHELENRLYKKRWIVYAKQAFGGPTQVIKYLGCYTHRVAISTRRILSHANGLVAFSYKDRKKENASRIIRLPEKEFSLRFLQHILPKGFMKMRSYGFLANRKKKESIMNLHQILGSPEIQESDHKPEAFEEVEMLDELSSSKICPKCGKQTLIYSHRIREFWKMLGWEIIWAIPYWDTS